MFKKFLIGCAIVLPALCLGLSAREMFYSNEGKSVAHGSVRNGSLENAWILPFNGPNYSYFSFLSYYIGDNGYLHSRVQQTVLDAYKTCETTCLDIHFRLMETANLHGGKLNFHRTHQNGLSVDFMSPLVKDGEQYHLLNRTGIFHYALEFDEHGRSTINSDVQIDFETMARHLLALDDACRKNGLGIVKVIWKINLKDELFNTPSGQELQKRGIYFVRALTPIVDQLHDDHYHIDFELL